MNFSLSDVCNLVDIDPSLLEAWLKTGIATPIPGGQEQFTEMQVLGLMVGSRVFLREPNCSQDYLKSVVQAFSLVTPEWLQTRFVVEECYLAAVVNGRPILRRQGYAWVNVAEAYDQIKAYSSRCDVSGNVSPSLSGSLIAMFMLGMGAGVVTIIEGVTCGSLLLAATGLTVVILSGLVCAFVRPRVVMNPLPTRRKSSE